jgi:hypothetical protein
VRSHASVSRLPRRCAPSQGCVVSLSSTRRKALLREAFHASLKRNALSLCPDALGQPHPLQPFFSEGNGTFCIGADRSGNSQRGAREGVATHRTECNPPPLVLAPVFYNCSDGWRLSPADVERLCPFGFDVRCAPSTMGARANVDVGEGGGTFESPGERCVALGQYPPSV